MTSSTPAPRRAEVLAGLSVAIDLGLGQPAEHMLRASIVASRLARRLGLDAEQQATVFYTTQLMWIGCNADSQEYARWFGDDIAVRRDAYLVDWSGLPYLRFLIGNVARGAPAAQRIRVLATLIRDARGQLGTLIHSHCTSAALLARHLNLGADIQRTLAYTFERYDGAGLPTGASGDQLPIEMRIAQLADVADVHERLYGIGGAVAMARSRRGGHLDPVVVDAFTTDTDALFPAQGDDPWNLAVSLAPDADDRLDGPRLDGLLAAIGDFVDLKCPFTLGHARNVAALAEAAAVRLGFPPGDVVDVRRAGLVHDVGRIGVSNQVWQKPSDLTGAEWERVRMHAYLTDRVLTRISGLGHVASIARAHHEHLDGSGYPLGLSGRALGRPERLLAAAVAYRSAVEPRPYRDALDPESAAARLKDRVARGQLDAESVEAVLAVSGHRTGRLHRPDALTARESEILGLVARGLANRDIARRLVLSEKTVRNHVEHIYTKIGATNRVGASLYALEQGLVGPGDQSV